MNRWSQQIRSGVRRGWQALIGLAAFWLLAGSLLQPAAAVTVTDVFAAEVEVPAGGGLPEAFDIALEHVLVKATGLPALGTSAARASLVGDAAAWVSRYSTLPENRVRVEFDPTAVQAALDAAGQPLWGAERPLIMLWFAADLGNGNRQLLGTDSAGLGADDAAADAVRERLLETAANRGLPVVLPLLDSEDLAAVSFADVWGEFEPPLRVAADRYRAEALLVGRARTLDPDRGRVRWRLYTGSDVVAWEGDVAAGPGQAADYFAQAQATFAGASDRVRLRVGNIATLREYGQLRRYLLSLNVVAGATIVRVRDDQIEFELTVRGDATRLAQTLDSGGRLQPAAPARDTGPTGGMARAADLNYDWVGAR
ncbi:MAG: DUF2066 domain-containing protein [Gammaproteobacteria bacterium]|jgi:hypothetical protein|nr:DUF2066 domain-containing protein [Gammaproteobacteria bacterium]